ncbi:MAG: alpha/beta hydrolase [Deltaproteobacteria bacterium]|nr:alpha/beta hydrolase [Deltaproteobacteria bacterium]
MARPLALLIHSGGFGGRQWRKLAELLAPTHDVLAPDLIGYGEPWPAGKPFHFRQDVERLAAMLDRPADVVGHSYGGFLALQLALARPDLVDRLAVYDPVAFTVLTPEERVRGFAGIKAQYELPLDEAWLAAFVDWWNGPGAWAKLPEPTREAFRKVGWKCSEEVATLMADYETDYSRVRAPTLVLGGGKSPEAERLTVERLARVIPHAELQMFEDLGHMGPIVAAERVNAAIALSLRR